MTFADRPIHRRELLLRAAAATVASAAVAGIDAARAEEASFPKPAGELVWDLHGHLDGASKTPEESISRWLEYADRMGIQRVVVSMGMAHSYDPSPDEMRRQNDDVLRAIRHAPERVFGMVYLNPKHAKEGPFCRIRGRDSGPNANSDVRFVRHDSGVQWCLSATIPLAIGHPSYALKTHLRMANTPRFHPQILRRSQQYCGSSGGRVLETMGRASTDSSSLVPAHGFPLPCACGKPGVK